MAARRFLVILAPALVAARGDVDVRSLLGFLLVGLVVGLIARLLVPGSAGMGFVATLVVGAVGAVLGGWLAGAVFEETPGVDWLASILAAVLLVWLLRGVGGRRVY